MSHMKVNTMTADRKIQNYLGVGKSHKDEYNQSCSPHEHVLTFTEPILQSCICFFVIY